MAQMVSRRLATAEVSEICGGQSDTWSGFLLVLKFLPFCTNDPYSFTHLSPTLRNVST
jgi:hypothetical protein